MEELEFYFFIGSIIFSLWAAYKTSIIQYHPLFFSWNPGLGFARLSVWIGFIFSSMTVVRFSASDIVSNFFYILFYLFLGYALIKGAGQMDPVYRVSYRVDVLERRNSAAGFYLGARVLAVALIFSGAMIGEGPGYHVVLAFFGLGWLVLESSVWLLCQTRGWKLRDRILRESHTGATLVIAVWYVTLAMILRGACAGDFLGWGIGLRDFAMKGSPILFLLAASPVLSKLGPGREAFVMLLYGMFFFLRML